jgi:glycosyltransferase involved in cell wall biosynthesis
MQPLNILHVFRAPVGGLFRHVHDLARAQAARGHRVGVIADSTTGGQRAEAMFKDLAPELALGLTRLPMRRQPHPGDAAALLHVMRRVSQTGADIVHGHGAKGGAYARLSPAMRRAVRVYTPHGGSLLYDRSTLNGRVFLTAERLMAARTDLFLFESGFSSTVFDRKIGAPRALVRVVHNGITRSEFAPVTPCEDATDIVFLGELRQLKGVDVLIDALAALRGQGRAVTATLVGDGPDREQFRSQISRTGLSGQIRTFPPMAAREALALGRMLVAPSRAESLPYVVLETAAAAMPMVTTNVGGIPEIYGPMADRLVPAGDVNALAAAVAGILDHPDTAKADAQRLQQRVQSAFSIDSMVEGVLSAYREALDAGVDKTGR